MEPHGALLCPSILMREPSVLISNHQFIQPTLYISAVNMIGCLLLSFEVLARSNSAAPPVVNCGLKVIYWSMKLLQAQAWRRQDQP
jgi:hypothetical protein